MSRRIPTPLPTWTKCERDLKRAIKAYNAIGAGWLTKTLVRKDLDNPGNADQRPYDAMRSVRILLQHASAVLRLNKVDTPCAYLPDDVSSIIFAAERLITIQAQRHDRILQVRDQYIILGGVQVPNPASAAIAVRQVLETRYVNGGMA